MVCCSIKILEDLDKKKLTATEGKYHKIVKRIYRRKDNNLIFCLFISAEVSYLLLRQQQVSRGNMEEKKGKDIH